MMLLVRHWLKLGSYFREIYSHSSGHSQLARDCHLFQYFDSYEQQQKERISDKASISSKLLMTKVEL